MDDEPWAERAACKGHPTTLFFPYPWERERDWSLRARRTIAEFCDNCPVRQQCGDAADYNREYGIWGGELRYSHYYPGRRNGRAYV